MWVPCLPTRASLSAATESSCRKFLNSLYRCLEAEVPFDHFCIWKRTNQIRKHLLTLSVH